MSHGRFKLKIKTKTKNDGDRKIMFLYSQRHARPLTLFILERESPLSLSIIMFLVRPSSACRGVNPERVPGYWVKPGNRLRVPGF